APMTGASRTTRPKRPWFTARSVAKATGGEVVQGGATGQGVAIDTRADCEGKVFVALRGEHHDSHDYLGDAVAKGCVGLVVDRDVELGSLLREAKLQRAREPFVVKVADTGEALLGIAREHRRRSRARGVGLTGSCGKTSTKEWLGAVVESFMPAVRSPGSYNNHVGVPLTLFQLRDETRAAVVEIGTNAPGEIAQLSDVARPDIGIVTCVAPAHLEGLGSLEGVAREKSCLPKALPADGVCILNGDDAACRAMAELTDAKVEFLSVHRQADWFATDVRFHALGTTFLLQGKRPVTLPRLGRHNVYNALAVIAAAHHLGVPEDVVLRQLASVPSAARRLEPKQAGGVMIFDDTYNMNPESARSALQAMAGLQAGGEGRGIAVFGGMAELGDDSESLHRRLGEQVVKSNHDVLVCVGRDAGAIADGAVAAGMPAAAVYRLDDVNAALRLLRGELRAGDRVLCKASRRVQLDRLVDRLVGELGNVGRRGEAEVSRG
ncbi:MAG: UDP-N-acetylmuramoyl-tripeptide--D-alanyl-D-alanine ligase, partial [Planctomycetota bacterium]|nr:UDP-N-acetylmuramoyl-tripeptide--D-alanyl-D-alanine ligase [Planctomycetota bacterium]